MGASNKKLAIGLYQSVFEQINDPKVKVKPDLQNSLKSVLSVLQESDAFCKQYDDFLFEVGQVKDNLENLWLKIKRWDDIRINSIEDRQSKFLQDKSKQQALIHDFLFALKGDFKEQKTNQFWLNKVLELQDALQPLNTLFQQLNPYKQSHTESYQRVFLVIFQYLSSDECNVKTELEELKNQLDRNDPCAKVLQQIDSDQLLNLPQSIDLAVCFQDPEIKQALGFDVEAEQYDQHKRRAYAELKRQVNQAQASLSRLLTCGMLENGQAYQNDQKFAELQRNLGDLAQYVDDNNLDLKFRRDELVRLINNVQYDTEIKPEFAIKDLDCIRTAIINLHQYNLPDLAGKLVQYLESIRRELNDGDTQICQAINWAALSHDLGRLLRPQATDNDLQNQIRYYFSDRSRLDHPESLVEQSQEELASKVFNIVKSLSDRFVESSNSVIASAVEKYKNIIQFNLRHAIYNNTQLTERQLDMKCSVNKLKYGRACPQFVLNQINRLVHETQQPNYLNNARALVSAYQNLSDGNLNKSKMCSEIITKIDTKISSLQSVEAGQPFIRQGNIPTEEKQYSHWNESNGYPNSVGQSHVAGTEFDGNQFESGEECNTSPNEGDNGHQNTSLSYEDQDPAGGTSLETNNNQSNQIDKRQPVQNFEDLIELAQGKYHQSRQKESPIKDKHFMKLAHLRLNKCGNLYSDDVFHQGMSYIFSGLGSSLGQQSVRVHMLKALNEKYEPKSFDENKNEQVRANKSNDQNSVDQAQTQQAKAERLKPKDVPEMLKNILKNKHKVRDQSANSQLIDNVVDIVYERLLRKKAFGLTYGIRGGSNPSKPSSQVGKAIDILLQFDNLLSDDKLKNEDSLSNKIKVNLESHKRNNGNVNDDIVGRFVNQVTQARNDNIMSKCFGCFFGKSEKEKYLSKTGDALLTKLETPTPVNNN